MRTTIILVALVAAACATRKEKPVAVVEEESVSYDLSSLGRATLSEYGFFSGALKSLEPAKHVVPYELNAPLFSDYAFKKRFIVFPEGAQARYHATDVFEFPVGTVLIKNFYYPADFRKPDAAIQILETRLLIHEEAGWKALPYIWNEEQTEAYLDVAGKNLDIEWTHSDGTPRQMTYSVPNMVQCKGCHDRNDKLVPIGLTARQLNRINPDQVVNQLEGLSAAGFLAGLPAAGTIPRLTNYEDLNQSVELRARAWLEVNCAHCHRPDGPAKTSGLHLMADVTNAYELGVGKTPVAAGRGSGGLKYAIVPGKPHESILYYRIKSTDPGVMMPELGKKMVHEEGVSLIRQWIESMK